MKILLVIGTYNESANLEPLVERLLSIPTELDLLIVDDNSPDGTGDVAEEIARRRTDIHVLHRLQKNGLASALVEGFQWALNRQYAIVVNIDGDLSHDPKDIPRLISESERADLAIGSRYIQGSRVINWGWRRLVLSTGAARYVRAVTGMPFADPTSGFRCFRRKALEFALRPPILSRGYSFHIECLHKIWRAGLAVREVPIVFSNRRHGRTKLSTAIVIEALQVAWLLLIQNGFSRRPALPTLVGAD